jgi:adenylosuccinate synthase
MRTSNKNTHINAHIVIGLGYGDEGKGITTDYLCSRTKNPIVVRFSGGQQAGHTVMHNGLKHIHSNFGSGSLRDVPTYFSEHTVFYPVTIARELKVLKEKGLNPKLVFHPLAKMTIPFDVFENRFDNKNRADGTCGLGIGKTMRRNESPYKLYAIDLLNPTTLKEKVDNICKLYYKTFVTSDEEQSQLLNEIDDFNDAIMNIAWEINSYDYLRDYDNIIFEGSQGIMLDMDHGVFPHVTFANTTSKNAHEILDKLKIKFRDIYYVTRCYLTRHGSGPFLQEDLGLINNEEEINVFNEYQKEFKTASIDYKLLNQALAIDNIYSENKFSTRNLMVTCLDQIKNFEFDYDELNITFSSIYESRSPLTENISKKY